MGEAVLIPNGCKRGDVAGDGRKVKPGGEAEGQNQLLALVLAAIRKSVVPCRMEADADEPSAAAAGWRAAGMEIGWPTDVRHVAHVTFDRLQGFLGLPVEFELEMPCQVPSASASVFGVSAESMQCGYDANGNSVPKILLLMQERLYAQGGLKAEGIFRITPENSQEARVREQLNKGIVPDDIDVHCLASLVKAWFRELPEGVLDSLSPEQVLQCNTEEECIELVKLLPPTEAALLNWIVELMADVVEEEEANKMNARNIAMVFAPNMTQMSDPLTALMHAVQVMNLLKTLILKTLREREDEAGSYSSFSSPSSSDQLDDDNENENYVDGDYESLKGIDKASELRAASERHSQHELPLIGASRRHSSIDCHLPYASYSSDDEDELLNDIEECFLRRLEEGKESSEGLEKDGSNDVSPNKEAKQLNFSECKNGSCKTGNEMRTLKDVKDEASNEPETIGSRISIKKTELSSVMKEGLSFCS